MMRLLDLFSGIGGFSVGLERAGFQTVAFCEIDPFCQCVLKKHWPRIPIYDDIRSLTAERLTADGIAVDVISGGFPCQDISVAGPGAGINGARSGLWTHYARIIGEVRPRYAVMENVSALLGRGLERVLGDLAEIGYDAEWHCIPAAAVGAPHRRDRVWIVAYPGRDTIRDESGRRRGTRGADTSITGNDGAEGLVADATCQYVNGRGSSGQGWRHEHTNGGGAMADADDKGELQSCRGFGQERRWIGDSSAFVANADKPRLEGRIGRLLQECTEQRIAWANSSLLHTDSTGPHASTQQRIYSGQEGAGSWHGESQRPDWWLTEPDVGRVANGVSARVDRLRSLGNAIVPQIAEIIGRAIMAESEIL